MKKLGIFLKNVVLEIRKILGKEKYKKNINKEEL